MKKMIHLAADHAGLALKERTKVHLKTLGYRVKDHGAHAEDSKDDYPLYMIPAAQAVVRTRGLGIFFGGSGLGECIAANKVRGIRAAAPYDAYTARMSRVDNDANVICFGTRTKVGKWSMVKKLIKVWLKTKFSEAARHKRRLQQIAKFENRGSRKLWLASLDHVARGLVPRTPERQAGDKPPRYDGFAG